MKETFEEKTMSHIEDLYVCYERALRAQEDLRDRAHKAEQRDKQLLVLAALALAVAVTAIFL